MQFNVSSLLQESTGATREYDIDDDLRVDGDTHRLTGRVRFDRTPRGILVRARMHGTAPEVSRCLKPLTVDVHVEFDEMYYPLIDVHTGARVDLEEGIDDAYRISERHIIDLAEPAAQYWSMALPMAPLCDEDCAGLCPVCGDVIADGTHACARDQVDARWSRLADLKLG
ncbi:MAG TPA: DUF177 domain-containing protein [Dehalococcoidia bacterium]|nr:DUF177 domain-containing protein [Dehalococcoidia bacterium]